MPYITARDKARLYVRIIGRGKPLVMLHGFGMHSGHWLPSIWPLRKRFRFILPDFRGFGRSASQAHNRACVMSNYADDLEDTLNALQLKQVNLAGVSMGAFVALNYMKGYGGHRISRYLNIDQAPFIKHSADWPYGVFGDKGEAKLAKLAELHQHALSFAPDTPFHALPRVYRRDFYRELGEFMAHALGRPTHKQLLRQACRVPAIANQLLPTKHWMAYVRCLGAYLNEDYDLRPVVPTLQMPVHVMAGMKSTMYPWEGQAWMAETAPRGHFHPFHNSGHLPMLDEPRHFIRCLSDIFEPQKPEGRSYFSLRGEPKSPSVLS